MNLNELANDLENMAEKVRETQRTITLPVDECSIGNAHIILLSLLGEDCYFTIELKVSHTYRGTARSEWQVWDGKNHYVAPTLHAAVNKTIQAHNDDEAPDDPLENAQAIIEASTEHDPDLAKLATRTAPASADELPL